MVCPLQLSAAESAGGIRYCQRAARKRHGTGGGRGERGSPLAPLPSPNPSGPGPGPGPAGSGTVPSEQDKHALSVRIRNPPGCVLGLCWACGRSRKAFSCPNKVSLLFSSPVPLEFSLSWRTRRADISIILRLPGYKVPRTLQRQQQGRHLLAASKPLTSDSFYFSRHCSRGGRARQQQPAASSALNVTGRCGGGGANEREREMAKIVSYHCSRCTNGTVALVISVCHLSAEPAPPPRVPPRPAPSAARLYSGCAGRGGGGGSERGKQGEGERAGGRKITGADRAISGRHWSQCGFGLGDLGAAAAAPAACLRLYCKTTNKSACLRATFMLISKSYFSTVIFVFRVAGTLLGPAAAGWVSVGSVPAVPACSRND